MRAQPVRAQPVRAKHDCVCLRVPRVSRVACRVSRVYRMCVAYVSRVAWARTRPARPSELKIIRKKWPEIWYGRTNRPASLQRTPLPNKKKTESGRTPFLTMTDFNTHPQPRTFAPSKEDVLQNLQYFFGAPVSPEKLKDYSEHHAMTCAPPPPPPPPPPPYSNRLLTCPAACAVRRPLPRRVCRSKHEDPRHTQQPHPQGKHTPDSSFVNHQRTVAHRFLFVLCAVAPELADDGGSAILPD